MAKFSKSKLEKARYWGWMVERWQASGLSQAEFCRQESCDERQLSFWKRKTIAQSNHSSKSSKPVSNNSPLFIQVETRQDKNLLVPAKIINAAPCEKLEIVTADNQFTIKVGQSFSSSVLKQVIDVLREAAC
jgi:hypothetical protein